MTGKPKIALVYDWVTTAHGGAERVLKALHQAFPDAPLFTSVYDSHQAQWAEDFTIIPSWLQRIPGAKSHHRWLAPLMPLAFESFELQAYDIIISVTSAEAKGVITQPHQLHICYLLTPTRYLYSHYDEYISSLPPVPGVRETAALFLSYLKWWDQAAAARPDDIIPISNLVGKRVKDFYHRLPSPVVYPPVEVKSSAEEEVENAWEKLSAEHQLRDKDYYLVVSRLVPYKRIDVALEACIQLQKRLVIIGEGPSVVELKHRWRQLTPTQAELITFLPHQSQLTIEVLMIHARALLMPGEEDFGITAIEAVGYGTPAIVHQNSGAAELLHDGETGILLNEASIDELVKGIKRVEKTTFDSSHLHQNVRKYATTSFVKNITDHILNRWKAFSQH